MALWVLKVTSPGLVIYSNKGELKGSFVWQLFSSKWLENTGMKHRHSVHMLIVVDH